MAGAAVATGLGDPSIQAGANQELSIAPSLAASTFPVPLIHNPLFR